MKIRRKLVCDVITCLEVCGSAFCALAVVGRGRDMHLVLLPTGQMTELALCNAGGTGQYCTIVAYSNCSVSGCPKYRCPRDHSR